MRKYHEKYHEISGYVGCISIFIAPETPEVPLTTKLLQDQRMSRNGQQENCGNTWSSEASDTRSWISLGNLD
jgi:hypothetical protein